MPISPQVNKDFETANGRRATVRLKLDKPDVNGVQFMGVVRLNGDEQMAGWRNDGTCPGAPEFTLKSLWPADDSRQYQPVMKTDDGVYRAMASYFAELGSLRHDWIPRGCKYALKLERSPEGPPTAEIIDLSA